MKKVDDIIIRFAETRVLLTKKLREKNMFISLKKE